MTLVLGAFGGLNSSDPPMKGIGILKGPPDSRDPNHQTTVPNHGDPNHWLVF